mmetsp:Transcript_7612/g.9166  ORF Transcript_7612/g.9166 Transcript_7612/m.9166 type:complete len:97 (+) Transcript_7612:2-292(+)
METAAYYGIAFTAGQITFLIFLCVQYVSTQDDELIDTLKSLRLVETPLPFKLDHAVTSTNEMHSNDRPPSINLDTPVTPMPKVSNLSSDVDNFLDA